MGKKELKMKMKKAIRDIQHQRTPGRKDTHSVFERRGLTRR